MRSDKDDIRTFQNIKDRRRAAHTRKKIKHDSWEKNHYENLESPRTKGRRNFRLRPKND